MANDAAGKTGSSRLGVLSLTSALLALVILCGYGFWGAGIMMESGEGAAERLEGIGMATNVASVVLVLAAIVLGILSLRRKEPRSGWGFTGLVLGGLLLLGFAVLTMMWFAP